jgi:hypothetical protein
MRITCLWAAVPGAATLLLACEAVLGIDFDSARPRPHDAGTAPLCELAKPPGAPEMPGGGDELELTLVVQSVDYGDRLMEGEPVFPLVGYDVDDHCTGAEPAPCQPSPWVGVQAVDGPGGRDNGVGRILLAQEDVLGGQVVSSSVLNESVTLGLHAPLGVIRIRGYGGFSDDDHVVVDWFVPVAPDPEGDGPAPTFDGNTAFPVAEGTVRLAGVAGDGGDGEALLSQHRDEAAYVNQRVLVARFSALKIPMANVYFDILDVVLSGKLDRDLVSGAWRLEEGLLSGTSRMEALIDVVPVVAAIVSTVALCPDNPNFGLVKRMICTGADVALAPAALGGDCDGVSLGVAFTTAPALLGAVLPPPALSSGCAPATPDVANCTVPP